MNEEKKNTSFVKEKQKFQKDIIVLIGVSGLLVVINGLIESRHKDTQVLNEVSDQAWKENLNENNNKVSSYKDEETIVAIKEDLSKGHLASHKKVRSIDKACHYL